jgi:antitoxin component YwqK of YwqJK toxin-antitoxin module
VKNGLPIGTVKFYSPKGDLIVERVFNKEGSFVRSILEPFSTNWKFDFNNSNLILYDFKNAVKDESSLTTLNLMSSVYQDSADVYRNYIYSIIDKSVYSKAFKVNGQKFTGVLKGYYFKKSTGAIGYEVSIKNGYLEGDVITFNESGDTSLYEIFSHGKLIKTLIEGEDGVAKPIIYLYPIEDTDIKVSLKFDGELSHTYPSYNNGWFVHAKPSGQLYDKDSLEYYGLYWEGKNNEEFVINDGFVVAGNESAKFLNDVLKQLGLNRREANEFIVYWLPKLESSPYNLIHFAFEDYESMAKLIVEPKPDETIRVMMVFQPLNQKVLFKEQRLPNKVISRNGFTVVEWGGTEIKSRYFTSNGIK